MKKTKGMCGACGRDPGDGWYIYDEMIWCDRCWRKGPGERMTRPKVQVVAASELGDSISVYFQMPTRTKGRCG